MNPETYFKTMYFNIWQSHDISRIDEFYAQDFKEIIQSADENKQPIELHLSYDDLVKQAHWQKEHYRDTTLEIKAIIPSEDKHLSVNFYSTSIDKKSGDLKHRCVCGIWRLNKEDKIDRVWAVVTPYYSD